jgi:hypothetical protein
VAGGAAPAPASGGDSARVSEFGQLLSKLKQLQQSDPQKFKQVMSQLADSLKADAQNTSDPHAQEMLNKLSSKFAAAGELGDLSGLSPAHHGHHAHGGHGAHGSGSDRPPPVAGESQPTSGSAPDQGSAANANKWAAARDQFKADVGQLLSIVNAA